MAGKTFFTCEGVELWMWERDRIYNRWFTLGAVLSSILWCTCACMAVSSQATSSGISAWCRATQVLCKSFLMKWKTVISIYQCVLTLLYIRPIFSRLLLKDILWKLSQNESLIIELGWKTLLNCLSFIINSFTCSKVVCCSCVKILEPSYPTYNKLTAVGKPLDNRKLSIN